jgi:D-alanyl-D-alanine carboxypeptidase
MTMYVHGRPAAHVRRRRAICWLVLLVAFASAAGWYGSTRASARGADPGLAIVAGPAAAQGDAVATGLNSELERRFTVAKAAAAAAGVKLTVTSGWRSAAEQQSMVDQAITSYGSVSEAHRWVLPPDTSEHVKGLAIDVGPTAGALWLRKRARDFGLCPTYANEVWHFEMLAAGATACPKPHPDASWGW